MVMGKGGVGKTTIAAAVAIGLVHGRKDGASEHDGPGRALVGHARGKSARPARRPHRSQGRNRALRREGHGQQRSRSG